MLKTRFGLERLKSLFEKRGLLILILAIIFIAFILYVYPKECKDADCFENALKKCDRAGFTSIEEGNVIRYEIGWGFRVCKLSVEMKEVNKGTASKLVKELEGKSMECNIPKDRLKSIRFKNFEDVIDYCSGRLKEGIYAVILERMYVLISRELGNVTVMLEEALAEEE